MNKIARRIKLFLLNEELKWIKCKIEVREGIISQHEYWRKVRNGELPDPSDHRRRDHSGGDDGRFWPFGEDGFAGGG